MCLVTVSPLCQVWDSHLRQLAQCGGFDVHRHPKDLRKADPQAQLCRKSRAHQILESSVSWQMSLSLTTPPSTHDSSQLVLKTKQNDKLLLNGHIVSEHICKVQD